MVTPWEFGLLDRCVMQRDCVVRSESSSTLVFLEFNSLFFYEERKCFNEEDIPLIHLLLEI